eukprot:sb/3478284/
MHSDQKRSYYERSLQEVSSSLWAPWDHLCAWGTLLQTPNWGRELKSDFLKLSTPLGGTRVFICASESFGSHTFVSWLIWSNQSFADSQNYALSGDIRVFTEK